MENFIIYFYVNFIVIHDQFPFDDDCLFKQ